MVPCESLFHAPADSVRRNNERVNIIRFIVEECLFLKNIIQNVGQAIACIGKLLISEVEKIFLLLF